MISRCINTILVLFCLFILFGCVYQYTSYKPSEEFQGVEVFDWYKIEFDDPLWITPKFMHSIGDTAKISLDTIPILFIDSICLTNNYTGETECSITHHPRVDRDMEYKLLHHLPIEWKYTDITVSYSGELKPSVISPMCLSYDFYDYDSCRSVTVTFPVKLLDRETKAVIDSQTMTVQFYRGQSTGLNVGP